MLSVTGFNATYNIWNRSTRPLVSTVDYVKSEPAWRLFLGERLIGYSNRLDRRARHAHEGGTVVIVIRSRYTDDEEEY